MKLEDAAFKIISAAGDGRAQVAEALKEARSGNFGKAEECLKKADAKIMEAHAMQTEEFLKKEAAGEIKEQLNVIVSHAQDYVMTALVMKEMAEEMVHIYEQLRAK
ncbi:PTS lactose/cellobiose transporter subunit IIA [Selenomonas sp. KH1T6]|uniref:PTS lactose/cellobiose transporter subunit IIA n=1 Tax=Selenomonas sp. KH1T6 TaxID=3158784 RepID=UPI0008A7F142|nr:PTS lactose/cellobiose transporter subunit IIA [Selenomonas ruminantium]SEH28995.1 PTS system, cellobiose-specific IIA component [Selenomonas ruminantium]